MAAWQFDVLAVFDGSTSLPPALKRRAEKLLAEHFGPPSEMFKEFRVYGAARGNRIDLIVGEDGCGELWMRVDARAEIDTFMRQVEGRPGFMVFHAKSGLSRCPRKKNPKFTRHRVSDPDSRRPAQLCRASGRFPSGTAGLLP